MPGCIFGVFVAGVSLAARLSSHYVQLLFWSGSELGGLSATVVAGWFCYFSALVKIWCQDNNGHQQRLPGWLLNTSWCGGPPQSPSACFRGSVLTRHCRREQRRQRGKLTLVSILFRVQRTPNQTGSSGCFYQRGHCVQHNHSTVSLQPRSPTTLISNQPIPPPPSTKKNPTQKLRGAKPAVITGWAEDWPWERGFWTKAGLWAPAAGKSPLVWPDHSGPKQKSELFEPIKFKHNIFAQWGLSEHLWCLKAKMSWN